MSQLAEAPLKSMERCRKLHCAPSHAQTWREQGLDEEERCPSRDHYAAVCSAQGQALNLPGLSPGQLPQDTALYTGLCRAGYPAVLWLHQQPCRTPQVRGEVLQPVSYAVILLIFTLWLQHPQSELWQSATRRRKKKKSWIQLSHHMRWQERSPPNNSQCSSYMPQEAIFCDNRRRIHLQRLLHLCLTTHMIFRGLT